MNETRSKVSDYQSTDCKANPTPQNSTDCGAYRFSCQSTDCLLSDHLLNKIRWRLHNVEMQTEWGIFKSSADNWRMRCECNRRC